MTCVHHWVLEDGLRDVPGKCRQCGAERVFTGMSSIDVVAFASPFVAGEARAYDPDRERAARMRSGEKSKQRAKAREAAA